MGQYLPDYSSQQSTTLWWNVGKLREAVRSFLVIAYRFPRTPPKRVFHLHFNRRNKTAEGWQALRRRMITFFAWVI